ncbi:alpha/beta hydrolase family protein [Ekhidna sp.]|uniref:alpha/beta hydrolase family protein n=1 Tax=Ekhidna sp. TaxID=2608089 RepID=UPI003BAAF403
MKELIKLTCILGMLFAHISSAQKSTSPLWLNLIPGKYDVGFKAEFLVDTTRMFPSSDSLPHALKGRPIRVKVYYPGTKQNSSLQMSFEDQIRLYPSNPQFANYNAVLGLRDINLQGQFGPRSDSLMRVLFRMETMAYSEIPVNEGTFPMLIYNLGLDDHQMENSVLWEYLASHGYIVVVIPCLGNSLENKYVNYNSKGLEGLYLDALFALNTYRKKDYIDKERIGAIGHSFGGAVAALLACRNSDVKAVASLDGTINNPRSQNFLDSLDINANTMQVPLLNLYTKAHDKDLTIVESLETPVYDVGFHRASHFDFQNFGLFAHVIGVDDSRVVRRRSSEEGKDVVLGTITLTKSFFDYYFFDDLKGLSVIKGEGPGSERLNELGEFKN